MHESFLIYLSPGVAADIDDLGLLKIVRGTQFDASLALVAFERLRDMDCSTIG